METHPPGLAGLFVPEPDVRSDAHGRCRFAHDLRMPQPDTGIAFRLTDDNDRDHAAGLLRHDPALEARGSPFHPEETSA